MLQLLALACVLAAGLAEPGVEPAAAANPVYVHRDDHNDHYSHHDEHHDFGRKVHVSEDIIGKQHKIIERVYSPDYYEPMLVLDYRYLKSGGRDYTRGPGGQIIILPHGIRSHDNKDHRDYDSLIEFLRLRHLAQSEAKKQRHDDEHHPFSNLEHKDIHRHSHGHKHDHEEPWY